MSAERRARRLNAIGVIVVALVAATWLLASNGVLGPVDFSDPHGPDPRLKDKRPPEEPPAPNPEAVEAPGPVGVGSLAGDVVEWPGGPAVDGASVHLSGTGNGGEPVALDARTSADGAFSWRDVPAGAGYALKIETRRKAVRSRAGIVVRAGEATDLGPTPMVEALQSPATPR